MKDGFNINIFIKGECGENDACHARAYKIYVCLRICEKQPIQAGGFFLIYILIILLWCWVCLAIIIVDVLQMQSSMFQRDELKFIDLKQISYALQYT